MDHENFRKLTNIVKQLDRLKVAIPRAELSGALINRDNIPRENANGDDLIRGMRTATLSLEQRPSISDIGLEHSILTSDFDEFRINDISPRMIGLLFDRIMQITEFELFDRLETLKSELSTVAQAELASRQKLFSAVQASDRLFEENQKLSVKLGIAIKEKDSALISNQELRERLHELQMVKTHSYRLESRVKHLEKLLADTNAAEDNKEESLHLVRELDDAKTQLMLTENGLRTAQESEMHWKKSFKVLEKKTELLEKIVSRRRPRRGGKPRDTLNHHLNFGVRKKYISGLLTRIDGHAYASPVVAPKRHGSDEDFSLFSELATQKEEIEKLDELKLQVVEYKQQKKLAETDLKRAQDQISLQQKEVEKLGQQIAEKDQRLRQLEERMRSLQQSTDESHTLQGNAVNDGLFKSGADWKAKGVLIGSLRDQIAKRDQAILERDARISDLLVRIQQFRKGVTLDISPEEQRIEEPEDKLADIPDLPKVPELPNTTGNHILGNELRRRDREWQQKIELQREQFLDRIHRVQRDLIEREAEIRDLLRRRYVGSGELQQTISMESIQPVKEQPRKVAAETLKRQLLGASSKTFKLAVPGAVTTVRIPAGEAIRCQDIILHVSYPPQTLLVDPITRSFAVENIDESTIAEFGHNYTPEFTVDLGATY